MSAQPHPDRPDYPARFQAVTRAAAPLPSPAARVGRSEAIEQFIDICDGALDLAFDDREAAVLTPDVDVPSQRPVLKAYLLFLATEGLHPMDDIQPQTFEGWYERIAPPVWALLGFEQPPHRMMLGLAFSLLGQREHQARELRALIWAIGDFASCNLLRGVRS
jgi:hypothetical protein